MDVVGMLNALEHNAQPKIIIVLEVCAHNPTRVDPSTHQWQQIATLILHKRLFVVSDCAYQGFATGNINVSEDATHPGLCVPQSFSKNFGLYGERVGASHLAVPRYLSTQGARGALLATAQTEYSNPPRFWASIVKAILGDRELRDKWEADLCTMSLCIRKMRCELRHRLEQETQRDWAHVERQIEMFSYMGLNWEQVARLRDEFYVYLLPSGRMSVCGLNESNVQYVAHAIGKVMK